MFDYLVISSLELLGCWIGEELQLVVPYMLCFAFYALLCMCFALYALRCMRSLGEGMR